MNRLLFSLKTCQKSGAHFSGKKKAPAATCPEAQGFQKLGANSWKYLSPMKHWRRIPENMFHQWKMGANSWTYFPPMKKWRQKVCNHFFERTSVKYFPEPITERTPIKIIMKMGVRTPNSRTFLLFWGVILPICLGGPMRHPVWNNGHAFQWHIAM